MKRGFNALLFSLTACKMALSEPCDVVIASSGPITIGIPALVAKWFRGKKMVFEIRDLWPMGAIELGKLKSQALIRIALWFEKLCYKNALLVVACSTGMESNVKKRFPDTNTLVIPNASDPELFFQKPSSGFQLPPALVNKKIFLYAGSLGLIDYGVLMINAMKRISDPDIHLVILGEGAEKKDLEKEVINLKLKNVHFLRLLPKTAVVNWFHIATASLVTCINKPVLQNCSPNKLFDSFAAGVPVIHNTTGWIKDVVNHENCGISIEPEDASALAAAIIKIAGDTIFRNHLASNAIRLSKTVYNRDLLSEKYIDAITKI